MATNCSAGTFSCPPKIADFFHSFAHLNFDFHNVSSVFVPTLEDYQQVLFLYAVVPCLFGGLVFLIFCVHFIASWCSCDKQHRPGQKCVSTLRCIVLLVSVLSSGLIIAAFVFNDSADQGVKGVLTAINNVNNTLVEIQSKINLIKDDLVDLDSNIIDVKSCTNVTVVQELIDKLRVHIGNIVTTVVKIKKVDLPPIEEYVQDTESHRWWITFGTLCLNTLSCLVLIYAVLRGSRCGFVLAVILGTFSLLLVWPSVGIDLALAVGMSDLCVNPKGTVYYYIKDQPSLRNTGVVSYYMECPTGKHNPFHKYADKAQRSVEKALTVFLTLMNLGLHLPQDCQDKLSSCQSDLTQTQTSMSVITKNLDCTYAHEQFKSAHCFLCDGVVVGIAELLLVTLIIGVLVIIHLSLVLPIYLRIRKHRKRQSILDMCGLDSPIGTPYQSISEDDNRAETVSLIASAPLPSTYNSINHRSSMEFHSFEESGITGHYNHGATEPLIPQSHSTSSLTVNPAPSNPSIPSTRGQITSMAF